MTETELSIKDNINRIKENISVAAVKSGRKPEDITFIGVTKNFEASTINIALENGLDYIGENRVQELLEKYDKVSPKQWHLIGHLQTNKVKYIIDKIDLIHSVDSIKLLEEVEYQAQKAGIVSNILLQVNTSGEESKFGASIDDIWKLVERASALKNVKVRGLMTIAPLYVNDVAIRLHFDNTHKLYIDIKDKKYDNISMDYLSMGMSGDFEEAILAGSNMVRIGSAIFGKRY